MCFNLEDISFHYYNVHKRKRFCGKVDDANCRMWQWWNRVHLVWLAYHVMVIVGDSDLSCCAPCNDVS